MNSNFIRPFFTKKAVLIFLLLLAFSLRLYNIDTFSFWTDEGLTPLRSGYSIAEILSNRITIQQGITNDTHPPFFFLLIHFSRQLFGETDFAYRYPSALAGVMLLPMIYQFGRRLQSRRVGYIAALLTAINPLYIWYSNEARMYTLYVLLMLTASYMLWNAAFPQKPPHPARRNPIIKHLILYLIFAGLALYTHYTAVFVIAFQAPFWMWLLWKRGQRRVILGIVGFALLAAIPLIPYTVPRLFRGAEANFFYVQPLVMIQDVFRFFALGTVVDFKLFFIQCLVWGTALILFLGVLYARTWLIRLFLLAYLFSTVLGLMAGSYIFKPMYQGVRHIMVGSPAFILLVSLGVCFLWQKNKDWFASKKQRPSQFSPLYFLYLAAAVVGTALPLVSSLVAVNNLFNNPRYAKDHLRQMVQFVERQAGDNDVIVYNNAILLPLHAHYQQRQDVTVTASPIYPTRAENTAAAQLEALAATYDRIWFVTDPPADSRDKNRFVRQWLNENSVLMDDYPFWARKTVVGALVYDTQAQFVRAVPETAVLQTHEWPGTPTIRGFQLKANEPINTPAFWFDIYWQGVNPENMRLRFQLRGEDGRIWALSEQALIPESGTPPPWPDEELIRFSYPIQLPLGTPPGRYELTLQPFNGGMAGETQTLTAVMIDDSNSWMDAVKRPFADRSAIYFENGITLRGFALADAEVRPGHTLPLTLYWQAEQDRPNLSYRVTARNSSGEIVSQTDDPLLPDWVDHWPTNSVMSQPTGLYFPPETPPGTVQLTWELFEGEQVVPGRPFWQPWTNQSTRQGKIEVIPWALETTLPTDVFLIEAQFGDAIELHGYTLRAEAKDITLTLYWLAKAVPEQNYTVFIHIVDETGDIVQQRDIIPVEGLRPTKGWRPSEVLKDVHQLTWPDDLPDGTYTLRIGLYEPDTFNRPTVLFQGEVQPDNQLNLGTVTKPK